MFFSLQLKAILFSTAKTYACCTLVSDLGHLTPASLTANEQLLYCAKDRCMFKQKGAGFRLPSTVLQHHLPTTFKNTT
jgi:hypothetical protein